MEVPELVATVLQHYADQDGVPDKGSLVKYLKVNRVWFKEATILLWRYYPPKFGHFSDFENARFYAERIGALELQWRNPFRDYLRFSNLKFPRLETLTIIDLSTIDNTKPYQHCLQYLHPRLKTLQLEKCNLFSNELAQFLVSYSAAL